MTRKGKGRHARGDFVSTLSPEEVRQINEGFKADLIRLGAVPGSTPPPSPNGSPDPRGFTNPMFTPDRLSSLDATVKKQLEVSFVRNAIQTTGFSFKGLTFEIVDDYRFKSMFFASPKPFAGVYQDLLVHTTSPPSFKVNIPQGCSQGVREGLEYANATLSQIAFEVGSGLHQMRYSTKFPDHLEFEADLQEYVSILMDQGFKISGAYAKIASASRVVKVAICNRNHGVVVEDDLGKPQGMPDLEKDKRRSVIEFLVQCPYLKQVK